MRQANMQHGTGVSAANEVLAVDMLFLPVVGVLIKQFRFDTPVYADFLRRQGLRRRMIASTLTAFLSHSAVFLDSSVLNLEPDEMGHCIGGEYRSEYQGGQLVALNFGDCIRRDYRGGRPLGSSINHAFLHETGHLVDDKVRGITLTGMDLTRIKNTSTDGYTDSESERSAEAFATSHADLELVSFGSITNYALD